MDYVNNNICTLWALPLATMYTKNFESLPLHYWTGMKVSLNDEREPFSILVDIGNDHWHLQWVFRMFYPNLCKDNKAMAYILPYLLKAT